MANTALAHQGEEKRGDFRRRSLVSANVICDNRMSTFDVVIRNRSNDGYRLETENAASIPSEFSLSIPGEPSEVRCRVVWRAAGSLGVRIIAGPETQRTVEKTAMPSDPNSELRARLAERFPHLSKKR